MKEGNFYFSMAPEIHEAKIEDGVLKVKTSPVEKIFVVTDSRDCYKKLAPKGETITGSRVSAERKGCLGADPDPGRKRKICGNERCISEIKNTGT